MANTFTPDQMGAVALAVAAKGTGLLARTYRDAEAEFRQGVGATVPVRVRGFKANSAGVGNKTTPLAVSDVNEVAHDVKITENLYVRALASQEDLLSLMSVSKAVIAPAVAAITDAANAEIAALYNGLAAHATIKWSANAAASAIIDARAALLTAVGDLAGTTVYVEASPAVYADLLKSGALDKNQPQNFGSGVQVYESPRITSDAFVIHTDRAVAAALRAPIVSSNSANAVSVKSDDGTFAVTIVEAYTNDYAADDILTHVLFGASLMGEPKFDGTDGSVEFVPSAIRVAKGA